MANPTATPTALACNQWANDLLASNTRIIVPAIADYEVRREMIRAGKIIALHRLDVVRASLDFDPITQAAFDRAADL